ncbi:hypothetical protein CASFOL_004413 [Castilleja foliolosa]|uniref:Uncharacterized protein n=1 Tax=Castilleja foliolosa TaxID=1961234 RepID=A0ABD3EAI1_9LAMI
MVYDVVNGVQYMMWGLQEAESQLFGDGSVDKSFFGGDYVEKSEVSEESNVYETREADSFGSSIWGSDSYEPSNYESPVDESVDAHEEL